MKYAKELKALVLDNECEIYNEFIKGEKALYHNNYAPIEEFNQKYPFVLGHVCGKIRYSRYRKRKRCREKVASFVESGKGWFLTLTFKDSKLKTKEKTRRVNVSRLLKKISTCYIANIDYGDKAKNPDSNEREHYHAIILCDHNPTVDLKWWTEKMGFVKVRPIKPTPEDVKKVAAYTAKLSHHALKKSTERGGTCPRIIYSRNALD